MSPQPNYTLDDINAEIARRQLARQGSSEAQENISSSPVAAGGDIPPWAASRISSSGASPQASAQPAPVDTNSGQSQDDPGLLERAQNVISGMGRSLGTGAKEAVFKYPLDINKLLGLQAFEPTKRMFIDPLEARVQAIQAQEAKDTAGAGTGEQIARGAVRGAGNLVTLPLDCQRRSDMTPYRGAFI